MLLFPPYSWRILEEDLGTFLVDQLTLYREISDTAILEKDVFRLVTSVVQRKNSESPYGIEPLPFSLWQNMTIIQDTNVAFDHVSDLIIYKRFCTLEITLNSSRDQYVPAKTGNKGITGDIPFLTLWFSCKM